MKYCADDESPTDNSSSDEGPCDDNSIHDSDEDESAVPVFLWRPQTTEKMGEWEQHTKVFLQFPKPAVCF